MVKLVHGQKRGRCGIHNSWKGLLSAAHIFFTVFTRSQHSAESKWKQIIQIQHAVNRQCKTGGDSQVNSAENPIPELGPCADNALPETVRPVNVSPKRKSDFVTAELNVLLRDAGLSECVQEVVHHITIRKADRDFQEQLGRSGKLSHTKGSQPPGFFGDMGKQMFFL